METDEKRPYIEKWDDHSIETTLAAVPVELEIHIQREKSILSEIW